MVVRLHFCPCCPKVWDVAEIHIRVVDIGTATDVCDSRPYISSPDDSAARYATRE